MIIADIVLEFFAMYNKQSTTSLNMFAIKNCSSIWYDNLSVGSIGSGNRGAMAPLKFKTGM